MDPFKLLARSTKLAKSIGGNASSSTPSSGQNATPQLFGRYSTELDHAREARKRKRGNTHDTNASVSLPVELDFFGGERERKERAQEDAELGKSHKEVSREGEGIPTDALASEAVRDESMNEEECKRVLRSHKLKITVLKASTSRDVDDSKTSTSKKRKKRKEEEPDGPAKKRKIQLYPQPLTDFQQLRTRYNISRRLAENLEGEGYRTPTEVQLGSLPLLLSQSARCTSPPEPTGQSQGSLQAMEDCIDLLTVAPTGSGKTLAFLVPLLHKISTRRSQQKTTDEHDRAKRADFAGPQAIVIAPTKELASQIVNEGRKLSLKTGIKVTLMRKGMALLRELEQEGGCDTSNTSDISQEHEDSGSESGRNGQQDMKRRRQARYLVKADIIVSTPLTLLNAIKRNEEVTALSSVRSLVLDEADVLLDPLFREQVLSIWNACTNPRLQVTFWSATMGSNIEELVRKRTPPNILVRLVVGLKDSAIPNISHQLTYAATEQGKLLALRQFLRPTDPSSTASAAGAGHPPPLRPPFLVFTQTIPRAIALHSELLYDIPPEAGGSSRLAVLHADLSDPARDAVMTRFRRGEVWVLITTDLLARGVDFRGVNGVVNYDFPTSAAAYVHRVGRTGRAGREGGVAVTLYTKEDVPFVKNVANVIAASESMKSGAEWHGQGVQQWLLDALPKPSKRDKQRLKRRGIEVRRPGATGREGVKARISTKSGFQRTIERNRRNATSRDLERPETTDAGLGLDTDESEFDGFED